jgi:pimeloyl-ACP methyl ester carboxylesterase
MGVNVAIEAALAEPDAVASLVLLCGTAENPFRGMFHTDLLARSVLPLLKLYPLRPDAFAKIWQLVMSQPIVTQVLATSVGFNASAHSTLQDTEAYAKAVANIDPKTFFPLILEMAQGLTQNVLPRVPTPSLVIAGARDHVTPPDQQRRLAEALPQGEFVEMPLGSHNVQLDFGDYVGLKAEEFWTKRNLELRSST